MVWINVLSSDKHLFCPPPTLHSLALRIGLPLHPPLQSRNQSHIDRLISLFLEMIYPAALVSDLPVDSIIWRSIYIFFVKLQIVVQIVEIS